MLESPLSPESSLYCCPTAAAQLPSVVDEAQLSPTWAVSEPVSEPEEHAPAEAEPEEPLGCGEFRLEDIGSLSDEGCLHTRLPLTRDGQIIAGLRVEFFEVDADGCRVLTRCGRRPGGDYVLAFSTVQGGRVEVAVRGRKLCVTHNGWALPELTRVEAVCTEPFRVVFASAFQSSTFHVRLHLTSRLLPSLQRLAQEARVPFFAPDRPLIPGVLPPTGVESRCGMRVLSVHQDCDIPGDSNWVDSGWLVPETVSLRCGTDTDTGTFTFSSAALSPKDDPGVVKWLFDPADCYDVTGADSVWCELRGKGAQVAAPVSDPSATEDDLRRHTRFWAWLSLAFGAPVLVCCAIANGSVVHPNASHRTVLAYFGHAVGCILHDAVVMAVLQTVGVKGMLLSGPVCVLVWLGLTGLLLLHVGLAHCVRNQLSDSAFRRDPGPRYAVGVLHKQGAHRKTALPMFVHVKGPECDLRPALHPENDVIVRRLGFCRWVSGATCGLCVNLYLLGVLTGSSKVRWGLGAGALLFLAVLCPLAVFVVSLGCAQAVVAASNASMARHGSAELLWIVRWSLLSMAVSVWLMPAEMPPAKAAGLLRTWQRSLAMLSPQFRAAVRIALVLPFRAGRVPPHLVLPPPLWLRVLSYAARVDPACHLTRGRRAVP